MAGNHVSRHVNNSDSGNARLDQQITKTEQTTLASLSKNAVEKMKDKKIKTQAIAKPYTLTSRRKKQRELQSFLRSTQTQKRKQEMLLLFKKKVRRLL